MTSFFDERTRRRDIKSRLALAVLSVIVCACSSIDCPVQTTVQANYSVVDADGNSTTLKDTLYIISRRNNGTADTLLNRSLNTTTFQLSVGYTTPEDTLLFMIRDTSGIHSDMVYVKKENQPHFESVDCKMSYFHAITGVTLGSHNIIDSIVIKKTAVNYDLSSEHFHIYFKAER